MTFLWIFLPILLGVYFLAKDKYRNVILLIFSLIFYSWGEPKYIILMLISIIINYGLGIVLDKVKTRGKKRFILIIAILFNLGLLCYFKYFNFIANNINKIIGSTIITEKNIALPIGISFYTFQIMSYIIDLYREDIKVQKNILNLALYISFFPQLIAGPIVKYHDIDEQLKERTITTEKFATGIKRFVYGLAKKVILANSLAYIADAIFDVNITTINTGVAWLGAICYTLQIYFDFSGYSDMAIGLGKMFGFEFMENFNLPYISQSITEFWRRWHISLSTWFKEYLYIPLGGNRKGKFRTYINLGIVFLVTGIWHGAAWSFIAWGLYNGFFLIIERIKLKEWLDKNKFKILNHIYALLVIVVGWVLFRVDGLKNALKYIKIMFIPNNLDCYFDISTIINSRNIVIIIVAILFAGVVQSIFNKLKNKEKITTIYKKYIEIFVIFMLMFICIMMLASNTYNPFIYFRF
jgi:alginate O-acetyltransferase complex protein AlgI